MSAVLIPEFKWAENAENIYLTIVLPTTVKPSVEIKEDTVTFKGTADDKTYALDLKLLKKVDASKSTFSSHAREVEILLVKNTDSLGWWNQLLSDKNAYKGRVKINWDLWHDEDEEKEMPNQFGGAGGMGGMGGGFNPAMMQGMGGMGGMGGGMGGMGGMDFSSMMGTNNTDEADSDDEELPDLEATKDRDTKAAQREEQI